MARLQNAEYQDSRALEQTADLQNTQGHCGQQTLVALCDGFAPF